MLYESSILVSREEVSSTREWLESVNRKRAAVCQRGCGPELVGRRGPGASPLCPVTGQDGRLADMCAANCSTTCCCCSTTSILHPLLDNTHATLREPTAPGDWTARADEDSPETSTRAGRSRSRACSAGFTSIAAGRRDDS
jgi:hypothetical protein